VRASAEAVIAGALDALAPAGGAVLVANPGSYARRDLAFLPGAGNLSLARDGQPVGTQATADGLWIDAGELAPYSVTALTATADALPATATGLVATAGLLENDLVRVELNADGDITRIYDKANRREVLPAGAIANQFQAFEDRPLNWDAWDVDIYLGDKCWLAEPAESITVVASGPLHAAVEIRRRILHSSYVQRIGLAYNSAQIDVTTDIDWQDRHTFLKVAFPVDVFTPAATYEIQWGNTERPTHRNTSWDWARFETCAQKWVDLSEGDYGVSLLNDCKYGHDIKDNVIRLSLLRGPGMPDPTADLGQHRFAYSLLPHRGRWNEATVAAAYALNDPLLARQVAGTATSSAQTPDRSLVAVDAANVVIETVKQAEDGNGVIVRLYESQRRRGEIKLTAGFPVRAAYRTNLLEEAQAELTITGNTMSYAIRPYEIATFRLVPA
jgi:alpha-mannosidase